MADVVIVGGGPIGLAHAWGLKKLNPDVNVVVFEKYEEYQRKHTLIMQHQQLQKLMEATETMDDPDLLTLLKRLKKDPHIRTNELEQIFKTLAQNNGVEIITEEIKKETIQQQIFDKHPDARLIIGADGTHSVVSSTLFPEGNQVKHEFDYVLQLRFEVNGEQKADSIDSIAFYQQMARQGLIANEYVGHFADGKTPITMQMMISKQAFAQLKTATSKNPITPFANIPNDGTDIPEQPLAHLPEDIKRFIYRYLAIRIGKGGEQIDKSTIRVSVNEAPATHAEQVIYKHGETHLSLAGDAGLGLSYFKGLNAGLESSAEFLSMMKPAIKQKFADNAVTQQALEAYQVWFRQFVPKKIKEVADYSTYRIRSVWSGIKFLQSLKTASTVDDADGNIQEELLADYFRLLGQNNEAEGDETVAWQPYPHRPYNLVKLGQFDYVPITYTLRKIAKIFIDYFKPYKSDSHIKQDFKQPLVGIANTGMGLIKLVVGFFTFNPKRFADGFFTLLRGLIELTTTPATWFIKPIIRTLATIRAGKIAIESNEGMVKLVDYGKNYLQETENAELSPQKMHALLAVCNDLHRKFHKGLYRGQSTKITADCESKLFLQTKNTTTFSREAVDAYFSLFLKPESQALDSGDVSEKATYTTAENVISVK
ncbi:FAD-dependent oxidoreductase [Legionella cardiaca]|uniref:Kynurenine 3-monooxygenase n=1 Tax=Legionella cardiaca TaxID=1071983 RepID=A0ABY8AUL4_9GAMM|nr:hypothetical protein [Legionella cardiaca]WED43441.1 hypothetical protein PXX05_01315 [Legionella cardiaca]